MRGGGYETSENLRAEGEVVALLEQRWQCAAHKLRVSYKLDYALCRIEAGHTHQTSERIFAFCEIKTRSMSWEQLGRVGGFMLSLDKWMAAKELSTVGGVPFLLVVRAAGDTQWLKAESFDHDGLVWQGRKDRGDDGDCEPHVVLDVSRFRAL